MDDYYNSDFRKALALFGALDGLLFVLLGYRALLGLWTVIYNAETVLSLNVAREVLQLVFIVSLVPACLGLIAARRWAMILSCVQTPFRIIFSFGQYMYMYTFGFLTIAAFQAGAKWIGITGWIILLLEVVRLVVTLAARRKSFSDEWHSFFDAVTTTKRRKVIAVGCVVMLVASVFAGWDRREPSQKLTEAAMHGHLRTIERLLADDVDINETSSLYGIPPLSLAAFYGRSDVVRLLLRNGADVNATDKKGHSPLYHATRRPEGNEDIIEALREYGATEQAEPDNPITGATGNDT